MFEYKHLLPDPVFECNDLWYMRIDDTRSIQLKYVNGSPVLGFHDGWSAISVYTGLVSLYLLSLVRSQVVVTWIVSSDGRRLGDKLADLMADQLDLLREAVSSRGLAEPFGLVGDGMQLIGPLLLREILNLGTAADDDGAPDDIISSQDGLAMLGAPHGLHTVLRYDPGRPTLLLQEGWAVDDAGSCQGVGTISIVRAPAIYGIGAAGKFGVLANLMRRTGIGPVSPQPAARSVVHLDNAAAALVHLCGSREYGSGIHLIRDHDSFDIAVLATAVRRAACCNVRLVTLPNAAVEALRFLAPSLHASVFADSRIAPDAALTSDMSLPVTLADGFFEMLAAEWQTR